MDDMRLALLIPEQDAENICRHLLEHEEGEQGMIVDLKEEKDDVHDQQLPEEDSERIRLPCMWTNR